MAVLIIVLKTIVAVLSVLLSLRRPDRQRGHIRGRGEEPQPLDGRHRDPMGFADRLDQPHRKNHLTKQERRKACFLPALKGGVSTSQTR